MSPRPADHSTLGFVLAAGSCGRHGADINDSMAPSMATVRAGPSRGVSAAGIELRSAGIEARAGSAPKRDAIV